MGDVSIMARRLQDNHVQYGWSGNGGYYRSTGVRLLAWYEAPEDVEYLFGLGQTGLIGKRGSENGGEKIFLTHQPTETPCWLGQSEREIFSKIAFVDYGYFYDLDQQWYYIFPGPFRIKMPLELVNNNLDERDFEFDFRREVADKVLRYIFGDYRDKDQEFQRFLDGKGYTVENIIRDIDDNGLLDMYDFFRRYREVFEYFDDWVVVKGANQNQDIGEIIVRKQAKEHIETCEW